MNKFTTITFLLGQNMFCRGYKMDGTPGRWKLFSLICQMFLSKSDGNFVNIPIFIDQKSFRLETGQFCFVVFLFKNIRQLKTWNSNLSIIHIMCILIFSFDTTVAGTSRSSVHGQQHSDTIHRFICVQTDTNNTNSDWHRNSKMCRYESKKQSHRICCQVNTTIFSSTLHILHYLLCYCKFLFVMGLCTELVLWILKRKIKSQTDGIVMGIEPGVT